MGQTQWVLLSQDTVITNLTGNTCKLLLKLEMAEKWGNHFCGTKKRFNCIHLGKILCIILIEIMP